MPAPIVLEDLMYDRVSRLASQNGAKITRILEDRDGYADLYRTIVAGPSGQRADLLIGRIRYTYRNPFELQIIDLTAGELAGWARRNDEGTWSIYWEIENEGPRPIGTASTLVIGMDVLINGAHAALGRHDSQRITSGSFTPAPAA